MRQLFATIRAIRRRRDPRCGRSSRASRFRVLARDVQYGAATRSFAMKHFSLINNSSARLSFALLFIVAALVCLTAVFKSGAANPTSGSISTSSPPLAWDGTAAGGVSATGEMTCVEGVNCDTFTLTVQGT